MRKAADALKGAALVAKTQEPSPRMRTAVAVNVGVRLRLRSA